MEIDPSNCRVVADFATYAIEFNLVAPAAVVVWADEMIAAGDVPPPWLLDLALVDTHDESAVMLALRAVPGVPDRDLTFALVGGLVLGRWRANCLTIGDVRGIGWRLYRREFEDHDTRHWGVNIELEGEALDDGHLTQGQMRAVIDRELAAYEPQLALLPAWTSHR